MTAAQAAARLHLSPATVRRYCWAGLLPAVHHGRDWWIEEADLAAFITARQTAPPPKRGRPRRKA